MGVRGLTTFIKARSRNYYKDYELHDCYLVIDANSIAAQLYSGHFVSNDVCGGDYDKFVKCIEKFFKLLKSCNIVPLVIFDGGYEDKKVATVYERMKNKIKTNRHTWALVMHTIRTFPLFLREVFMNCCKRLEIKCVRCDFEADFDIACIARSLNCPVLSYDSDFYIFDVLYIPFPTFSMNVNIKKATKENEGYNYVYCKLFILNNFLNKFGGLNKEIIPLLATLLGNDYIRRSLFSSFYDKLKLVKGRHYKNEGQKRIMSLIKWLQNQTFDNAVKKVLGHMKTSNKRRYVARQIEQVANGYMCKNSEMLLYLDIELPKGYETEHKIEINPFDFIENDKDEIFEDELMDDEDDLETDEQNDKENIKVSDEKEEKQMDSSDESDLNEDVDGLSDSEEEASQNALSQKQQRELRLKNLPDWFKYKFRKCYYPSIFMDIVYRNLYFTIPQVEDYSGDSPNSHAISEHLINCLQQILTSGSIGEREKFIYVARNGLGIKRYEIENKPKIALPKLEEIKELSKSKARTILLKILNFDKQISDAIKDIPDEWKLYMLSLIYWTRNAKETKVVDQSIGYYRCKEIFSKKFAKNLTAYKNVTLDVKVENSLQQLLANISKQNCIFFMNDVINNFSFDGKVRAKPKLFCVDIINGFAQFQSCLMHINYLNVLLNCPFKEIYVSDFYNGTFLYNMCHNLSTRVNVDSYLETLMVKYKDIFYVFNKLKSVIVSLCSENMHKSTMKSRRKRKRKKNKKENDEDDEEGNVADSDDDTKCSGDDDIFFDVNNRFCSLKIK